MGKKLPHLYEKLANLAKEIAEFDLNQDIPRSMAERKLSSKFRITSHDARIALRELEHEKRLTLSERRIHIR